MTVVVDASVVMKWYVDEPGTLEAIALHDGDELLVAPDLLLSEVANGAWQKVRRGLISSEQATAMLQDLGASNVTFRRGRALVPRALELALEIGDSVYDCIYLALAEREALVHVTADEKLHRRVVAVGMADRIRLLTA